MKKSLFIAAVVLMQACQVKTETKTESQIHAKVDSLIGVKLGELNRQAMEDLDRRKAIEVKAKADSIVDAYKKTQQIQPIVAK